MIKGTRARLLKLVASTETREDGTSGMFLPEGLLYYHFGSKQLSVPSLTQTNAYLSLGSSIEATSHDPRCETIDMTRLSILGVIERDAGKAYIQMRLICLLRLLNQSSSYMGLVSSILIQNFDRELTQQLFEHQKLSQAANHSNPSESS